MHSELCIVLFPLCGIHSSDCYRAPAAGTRHNATGDLDSVGKGGLFFVSSTYTAGHYGGGCLHFGAESVFPLGSPARAYGFPVRCVQASARLFFVGRVSWPSAKGLRMGGSSGRLSHNPASHHHVYKSAITSGMAAGTVQKNGGPEKGPPWERSGAIFSARNPIYRVPPPDLGPWGPGNHQYPSDLDAA